jgi:hypothetical protein
VRPTTSRGLNSGGWVARPVRGEIRERCQNNEEGRMQFRSWARGEGELYTRKAARERDARSGKLNRKRQRTGNDSTKYIQ